MKLSRPLTLAAISVASVVSFAGPADATCGHPNKPACPTTTTKYVHQTTTTVPATTTSVAQTTTTATTVLESTTTVSVPDSTTTTAGPAPTTTEAPQVTTTTEAAPVVELCDEDGSNCEPFAGELPSTGNETGVMVTAGIAALLAGVYLVLRARRMVR